MPLTISPPSELATARATALQLIDRCSLAELQQTIQLLETFHGGAQAGLATPAIEPAAEPPKSTAEKHCVRCHATYSDATNGRTACVLFHIFGEAEDEGTDGWGETRSSYACACCSRATAFTSGDGGNKTFERLKGPEACWAGRHTTSKRKVNYKKKNVNQCWMKGGKCATTHQSRFFFHTLS